MVLDTPSEWAILEEGFWWLVQPKWKETMKGKHVYVNQASNNAVIKTYWYMWKIMTHLNELGWVALSIRYFME